MSQHVVLIVDDEVETIELLRIAFKRRGYAVLGAESGHAGLQLAREHRPAIMLIDLMMPGLNGFELCRQLRADPITAHIPQIILSAGDSRYDQAEALAAGANRYLVKPVDIRALIDVVADLIEQHPAPDNPA
jgi:CheY-like chemotaxis protein